MYEFDLRVLKSIELTDVGCRLSVIFIELKIHIKIINWKTKNITKFPENKLPEML